MSPRRLAILVTVTLLGCGTRPPAQSPSTPSNVGPARGSADAHTLADVEGVVALALDPHHVYFRARDSAGSDFVGRVDRMGGAVEVIAGTADLGSEIATTPDYVWWIDDGRVARAAKGTRNVEHLAVPYAHVDHLASSGEDVWIAARTDGANARLLAFEAEAATPRDIVDLGTTAAPYALVAADGEVALSGEWMAYSYVRGGQLVHVETGSTGSTIAVARDRMAVASVWLRVYPLDGGLPRTVSDLRMVGLAGFATGGARLLGGGPSGAGTARTQIQGGHGVTIHHQRAMFAIAGGGGRLAMVSGDAEYRVPTMICGWCVTTHEALDGTMEIALVEAGGAIEPIATGEDATGALAVDALGVVWATRTQLRAVDR